MGHYLTVGLLLLLLMLRVMAVMAQVGRVRSRSELMVVVSIVVLLLAVMVVMAVLLGEGQSGLVDRVDWRDDWSAGWISSSGSGRGTGGSGAVGKGHNTSTIVNRVAVMKDMAVRVDSCYCLRHLAIGTGGVVVCMSMLVLIRMVSPESRRVLMLTMWVVVLLEEPLLLLLMVMEESRVTVVVSIVLSQVLRDPNHPTRRFATI